MGVSTWALRRFEDKPFVSGSRLRFVSVLLSLLLFAVIDGSLTLSIKRGLSSDGDDDDDSCISPLTEGAGRGAGGGGGIDDDELLLSVCDVLSKPCHERRSFFARWAMSIRDGG
jgi:hypothetical protein